MFSRVFCSLIMAAGVTVVAGIAASVAQTVPNAETPTVGQAPRTTVEPPTVGQTVVGPAMTATIPGLGTILVGPTGRTLYTWDRDVDLNVSTCYSTCATNWPPFLVVGEAVAGGNWTIVPRTDGTRIWAYLGKPLYYFIGDASPGDTNGDQPTGLWHVVTVARE